MDVPVIRQDNFPPTRALHTDTDWTGLDWNNIDPALLKAVNAQ